MSTKNLARTIIEGGRYKGNKYDRRHSHAEERASVKNYLKEVQLDPEKYDEYDPEPITHVYKGFDDKLAPIYRWLDRQVGRLWDEVRSDISKTFDTRTTAGRHIVFDHMLRSVQINPQVHPWYYYGPEDKTESYSPHEFYVDDDGFLQKKKYIGRRGHSEPIPPFDTKKIAAWLNGRVVGKVGTKLFWFSPTGKNKKHKAINHPHIWKTEWSTYNAYYFRDYFKLMYLTYEVIYKKDEFGKLVVEDGKAVELERIAKWQEGDPSLRQDRKLNDKEINFWNSLPTWYQTKILERSPTYPEHLKPKRNKYY